MAVTMNARWDDTGTVIPGGDAEYVVAEQPIAEYDNWFNYNIVADIQAVIDDVINRFNANTILKADTDNTPAALVVAEQTIVGRKTGNSIAALIDTEVLAIIGVEAGATADQTNTEIRDAVEAAADSNTFTDADHTKLNGIEAAADVTDATNVAAATAVMDADFSSAEGFMRKTGAGAYTVIKSNLSAAVAPTVNEDSGDGYGIGSQWIDTTADEGYICLDATVGAAKWTTTTIAPLFTDHSNVVGSRTIGTTYQNTHNRLMLVTARVHVTGGGITYAYSDNATPPTTIVGSFKCYTNDDSTVIFFVQPGDYYKITPANDLSDWHESY